MSRRTLAVALLAWALWGLPAQAQTAPDPQAVAHARQLLLAMGAELQFDTAIKTMLGGLGEQLRRQHPAHAATISEVFGRMAEKFLARKGEALDMIAPVWAEKFNIAEMNEIAAFYKTPIGTKLLAVQPEIAQRSMMMGMSWGERIGKEAESEVRGELRRRGVPI
jgi:hypothetical protein